MEKKDIVEFCECGGEARVIGYTRSGNYRIPLLKCNRCGDVFEAHEDNWIIEKKSTGVESE